MRRSIPSTADTGTGITSLRSRLGRACGVASVVATVGGTTATAPGREGAGGVRRCREVRCCAAAGARANTVARAIEIEVRVIIGE
ncbi:MAG: hypothetical protein IPF99_09245 [Deltaproteobacteria bacterium]|nr:hypothetical protein [Deltaproteobacteria bacterium]